MEDNNIQNEISKDIPTENTDTKVLKPWQFQKGEDSKRNLAGKPKGARHFSTLIREAIKKVSEGDAEPADILIVKQLVEKAKKGDLSAIDRVIDRVDGKAEQTINLDGDMTIHEGLSKEDQKKLLNLL